MKTRNAFALKDFDAQRILQRNFFLNRLGFMYEDSDANIIDFYNVSNVAHLGASKMEERRAGLRRLKSVAEIYQSRLMAHADKISKLESRYAERFMNTLADVFKEKYEYANTLKSCYELATSLISKIISQISEQEKENEKSIQRIYREEFASSLKKIRLNRKLTQRELAARLDIAVPTLSQYENAVIEPTIKNLIRLANILDTTTDELLGRAV